MAWLVQTSVELVRLKAGEIEDAPSAQGRRGERATQEVFIVRRSVSDLDNVEYSKVTGAASGAKATEHTGHHGR
jgi:hypothetical protein